MSQLATTRDHAIPRGQGGYPLVPTRIVVRDAESGSVLHEYVSDGARIVEGPGEPMIEHDLAVPRGSVILLETGDRREAVARAIADVLSEPGDDVSARLLTLPAVAAWDLTPARARAVMRAIAQAGGRAVAV